MKAYDSIGVVSERTRVAKFENTHGLYPEKNRYQYRNLLGGRIASHLCLLRFVTFG